jgi:hypothetical protein
MTQVVAENGLSTRKAKAAAPWLLIQPAGSEISLPEFQVAGTGTEHPSDSSGNQGVALQGGAKSGALSGDSAISDPDLLAVVAAWPTLPEAVRQRVVAMVQAPRGE